MLFVRAKFDKGLVLPVLRGGRGLNEFMLLLLSTLVGGGELGETLLIQVEIGSQVALFFLEGG